MLDHYYVYVNEASNMCYFCNTPYHSELPGITEGWDQYTSFMKVYPTVGGADGNAAGRTVKFLLNDDEFIMPDWASGLCAGAINIINLDKCNCSEVKGTYRLFQGYQGTTLDLSMLSFDSLEMGMEMFNQCPNLVWIKLPKITWQLSSMQYMSNDMFSRCSNLQRIYITDNSYWDTSGSDTVHASTNMFMYSSKLPYYEAGDYPMEGESTFDADQCNTYVEVRRYKTDEWTGDLIDERVHRGGYFTLEDRVFQDDVYEKVNDDWEKKDIYFKDSTWNKCDVWHLEGQLYSIPEYEHEYDWDYYGLLPDRITRVEV